MIYSSMQEESGLILVDAGLENVCSEQLAKQ